MSESLRPHGPLTAYQAPLSFTNSWSLLKFISIKSVILSNHLIFCRPRLLLPSISPNIRVFSNELTLRIRWTKVLKLQLKHQSFQWLFRVDFLCDWLVWGPCMPKGLSRVFSSTTIRKHHFFSTQPKTKQRNMVKSWMLEATRAPSDKHMSQETSQDIVKLETPSHVHNPNNPWKIYIPASNMHIIVGKEHCLESEHCLTI